MCNGNCNQGRDCPDWRQCQVDEPALKEAAKDAAVVAVVVVICVLLAQALAAVIVGAP